MKYVNQKKEIKGGEDYCGASCLAMITEEDPQKVAYIVGPSADDETLTKFLKFKGYIIDQITDGSSAEVPPSKETRHAYKPSMTDFEAMRKALDDGKPILYHFAGWDHKSSGHYALVTGYTDNGFMFNDPAGDRNKKYFGKSNEGEQVEYSIDLLIKAGMKRLFSIGDKDA